MCDHSLNKRRFPAYDATVVIRSKMSLQERIKKAGRAVSIERKSILTADQVKAYEHRIWQTISTQSNAPTPIRTDCFRDGIVIAFVASDNSNLHALAHTLQDQHRAIIDGIDVIESDHRLNIRLKSLAPFKLHSNLAPVVVFWILFAALVLLKIHLGQDPVPVWLQ